MTACGFVTQSLATFFSLLLLDLVMTACGFVTNSKKFGGDFVNLDLVMTACGFVTLESRKRNRHPRQTRPCDDRLRFCDRLLL